MAQKDLNKELKEAAGKLVGKKALTSKYGLDCFALVDKLLRGLGAATAADGDVRVTPTADYDWGDGILLDSLQPGDIIQFKKHVVHIKVETFKDGKLIRTDERTLTRPHHTAIVMEVHKGGGVTVVEQNVMPHRDKVTQNFIPRLEPGEETNRDGDKKTTIKVTGEVHAYRPTPKPEKGAMLQRQESALTGGSREIASFVPSQGGTKRVPGPLGIAVRRPGDDWSA
jgi:hypothetical protein